MLARFPMAKWQRKSVRSFCAIFWLKFLPNKRRHSRCVWSSVEEIAQHAGAPQNTVRSRLRLAKEALKRRIESEPGLLEALEVTS